ncbi:MAG: nucleotidyltransferase family protein [Chitinophagaceae bacterium]|nr:nucleotidyltransferase family protein [Chitinophagaceae bacterium]
MHKDCIILAGGMGTRLQSVVSDVPKCMADINGKPFLHYLCQYLQRFHFCKVIFSVGYKKDIVMDYILSHRDEFKFAFDFAEEDEPLGTGGAILNALSYSDTDDFFVINGDTFFDVDLDQMQAFQEAKMADCTVALKPMQKADRYGLVQINPDAQIQSFSEKQAGASGLINGGIYCIFRNSFLNIPFQHKFSFEKDYLEKYLNERYLYGFVQDNYFIDIGIPEDYSKAQKEIPTLFTPSKS